jgi:hypothetical protein
LLLKNPEIKVARCCRGHEHLKILFVMEQRAVVRFLTLKNLSARGTMAELEGLDGHEALSLSALKE